MPILNSQSLTSRHFRSDTISRACGSWCFPHSQKLTSAAYTLPSLSTATLDDYLAVIDAIFTTAVAADAVCLKSTQAYQRSLTYEPVTHARAEAIYGKATDVITAAEQRDFEDFMFWQVCKLSEKHNLPFQIHTGQARVQGSNPLLLSTRLPPTPTPASSCFMAVIPGSAKRV